MKNKAAGWLPFLVIFAFPPATGPQNKAPTAKPEKQATAASSSDTQGKNVQEYIELLRSNVRQEKAQIMGAVMQLSADDAAKFWPIYAEYNAELTKVNDQRVANIEEYARSYSQLTDRPFPAREIHFPTLSDRLAENLDLKRFSVHEPRYLAAACPHTGSAPRPESFLPL